MVERHRSLINQDKKVIGSTEKTSKGEIQINKTSFISVDL
jgi:hypothetical protein